MKLKTRAVFVMLFALISLSDPGMTAGPSLYSQFQGKTVKVYVAEAKDSTQAHETDPKTIKSKTEEALKARKSITFEIVQNPEQAELLIETEVSEYFWTDHDPVDMLMGAAATAYDIATIEDYACLQADIRVTDVRTKNLLWKDRVMATITKKPMSRPESILLVTAELAKTFIKECFSRRR